MYTIVTSRFNNETRDANYVYRQKHNFACMYCSPLELSPKIPYNTPVFVIEMNNSTNKIEGIGLIKNKLETGKYYKVHEDGNNNRYIYVVHFIIYIRLLVDWLSVPHWFLWLFLYFSFVRVHRNDRNDRKP